MVHECKTKAEFEDKLKEAGPDKLVVVDFYATWCGPCRMIGPYIKELAAKHPDVMFLKVDVDENEELSSEQKIEAMPTFRFFKGGVEVTTVCGANKDKLAETVEANK